MIRRKENVAMFVIIDDLVGLAKLRIIQQPELYEIANKGIKILSSAILWGKPLEKSQVMNNVNAKEETKNAILQMLADDIPGLHIAKSLGVNAEYVTRVKRRFFLRHGITDDIRDRIIQLINDGNTSSYVADGLGISKEEVLIIREEYNLKPSKSLRAKATRRYQANLRDAARSGEKYSAIISSNKSKNVNAEDNLRRFCGADIRRLIEKERMMKYSGDPEGHKDHESTPLPARIPDRHSVKLLALMIDITSLDAVGVITSPLFHEIAKRAKLLVTTIHEDNDVSVSAPRKDDNNA